MTEEAQMYLDEARDAMKKSIGHLGDDLGKLRAGKAHPSMLDGLFVDYYGTNTPLSQVSNITTPDAKTLVIKPWEKGMLEPIEKSIHAANIGLNPMNDGEIIRISLPPLTEERRKELVKKAKALAEQAKVSIRNARRDAIEGIKSLQKEGLSEDEAKNAEHKVQELTNEFSAKVDTNVEQKEAEIMKV